VKRSPPLLSVSGRSVPLVRAATMFVVTAVALISAGGRCSPFLTVRSTLLVSILQSESLRGHVTPWRNFSAHWHLWSTRTIFFSRGN
jgi:hypothetical protein